MFIKKLLPKRTKLSNKTDGGKVLIIGGAKGLYGAGLLSALAATKCGAGYTHLMTDLVGFSWLKFPDFILHPLKVSSLKNKDDFSVGIGPGLGKRKINLSLLNYLLKNNFEKVTLDADALNLIAEKNISPLPSTWILTPHEGELARLLNISSMTVKNNRKKMLKQAGEKYQCVILLKGSETLIFSPGFSRVRIIKSSAVSLSKAGTGDVLLGMITAFRAQGINPLNACLLSCTIHAKAALSFESEGNDHLSLRPTDLINKIPNTIYRLRNSSIEVHN